MQALKTTGVIAMIVLALSGALPSGALAQEREAAPSADDAAQAEADREYAEALRRRAELIKWHRPFAIATWGSMLVTLTLGMLRYRDLYGFFDGQGDNPCVEGNAFFQDQCHETPIMHLVSALTTTVLYSATFTISLFMPSPEGYDEGDSQFASRLRLHKVLRWVHLFGMISQITLGAIMSNMSPGARANDYGTLQALATVHMGLGLVTFGALTWAGALMTF